LCFYWKNYFSLSEQEDCLFEGYPKQSQVNHGLAPFAWLSVVRPASYRGLPDFTKMGDSRAIVAFRLCERSAKNGRIVDMSGETATGGVRSVQLALDVLERVAGASEEIGVSELAVQLGTTKGSVFRHLKTLVERGYLSQNPQTSRYRLGVQAYVLGQAAAGGIDLLSASADALRDLRDELGLSVVLSVLQGKRLVVMDTQLGKSALEIGVRTGTELQLHCNAQGKVALAFARQLSVDQLGELPAVTVNSVTDRQVLKQQVSAVRQQGWAAAIEEETLGISAIAAPILGMNAEFIGAVALVATVQNIAREVDPAQVHALKKAALRASWNLGYRDGP
jgi:DNA-binding IclR family transcriptional regulator